MRMRAPIRRCLKSTWCIRKQPNSVDKTNIAPNELTSSQMVCTPSVKPSTNVWLLTVSNVLTGSKSEEFLLTSSGLSEMENNFRNYLAKWIRKKGFCLHKWLNGVAQTEYPIMEYNSKTKLYTDHLLDSLSDRLRSSYFAVSARFSINLYNST